MPESYITFHHLGGDSTRGTKNVLMNPQTWSRGLDLNQRHLGYEPSELPDCSTPQ